MKPMNSSGVVKALWAAGETQSRSRGTPRVSAISAVILALGSTPPWPGLAPWLSLISIIFTGPSGLAWRTGPGRSGRAVDGLHQRVVVAGRTAVGIAIADRI